MAEEIKKETYKKIVKADAKKPEAKKAEAPKAEAQKAEGKKIKVTLIKSTCGCLEIHRRTVQALGLVKIGQSAEFTDGPAVRGMIHRVAHMVKVEDVD